MQVIGFNFAKVSAERKKSIDSSKKLEIKSNINIKSISQEKVDIIKDQDALKFEFEFSVDYHPDTAKILFEGHVVILFEKNKVKEILKKWKNKKISDELRIPLFNLIMTKSNLKALQLEEDIGLPTHIPMPRIASPQNNQGYVQ